MSAPNTFATATTAIPLANLDANFAYYDAAYQIAAGVMEVNYTFRLEDTTDPTKKAEFVMSAITTGTTRQYTLPNITGTLATLANTSQTFTGSTSFVPATNSGTITIGAIPQTGTITVDRSTATHTLDIGVGATTSGSTKTINFGTTGVSGSTTTINYGSAVTGSLGAHIWNIGGEQMRLTSTGLGIGTISPAYKLDVVGQGRATTGFAVSADGSAFTPSGLNAIPNYGIGYFTSTSQIALSGFGGIQFYTNQLERMRLDSSGNLGIGTSSPVGKLDVAGTNGNVRINANGDQLAFTYNGYNYITASGASATLQLQASGASGTLSFVTGASERTRIDSSGNTQFLTGGVAFYSPTPTTITAAATLSNADIQSQIINTTGATAFALTLPLGTTLETLIPWASVDLGYDFYVINSATATITMTANTGVTIVGRATVLTLVSAQFRVRRTAANTFIVYRIN